MTIIYEIAVDDNGAGIAPEERDRIFDRFYQIQNDNPTMVTGSGVGLHLVRQLVILHHGSITVEGHSDGTSGSRFTVSIPKGTNHLRKEEIVATEVKPKREVAYAPLPQIQEIKKDKPRVRHRVLIVKMMRKSACTLNKNYDRDFTWMKVPTAKRPLT